VQVKKDHETRIAALTKAEEECIKKAHLIETNVSDVDAAIKYAHLAEEAARASSSRVVRPGVSADGGVCAIGRVTCSELARGMDWAQLTRVVKEAKKAGDPIANLIHSLDFANNRCTCLPAPPAPLPPCRLPPKRTLASLRPSAPRPRAAARWRA
jgi:hypothetical protein